MPKGAQAYREVWSDRREGKIVAPGPISPAMAVPPDPVLADRRRAGLRELINEERVVWIRVGGMGGGLRAGHPPSDS